jgi:hypothetical protein
VQNQRKLYFLVQSRFKKWTANSVGVLFQYRWRWSFQRRRGFPPKVPHLCSEKFLIFALASSPSLHWKVPHLYTAKFLIFTLASFSFLLWKVDHLYSEKFHIFTRKSSPSLYWKVPHLYSKKSLLFTLKSLWGSLSTFYIQIYRHI